MKPGVQVPTHLVRCFAADKRGEFECEAEREIVLLGRGRFAHERHIEIARKVHFQAAKFAECENGQGHWMGVGLKLSLDFVESQIEARTR